MGDKLTPKWSEEVVAALRRLCAEKLSSAEIASQLGVTRNAVLGKCYRLGINPANKSNKSNQSMRQRADRNGGAVLAALKGRKEKYRQEQEMGGSNTLIRAAIIARAKLLGILPFDEPVALPMEMPMCPPVALLDLQKTDCRWPICDAADNLLGFCGVPRRDDHVSYCHPHCLKAFRNLQNQNHSYFYRGGVDDKVFRKKAS